MSEPFEVALDPVGAGDAMQRLDRATCLELLATVPMARIGISVAALPVILPVNIALSHPPGGREPVIVIRSGAGSKLSAATSRTVVAVEADHYDPAAHTGWSVLVQGESRILDGTDDLGWASALSLRSWALPAADCFIAVSIDLVSGRRLGLA
jgi:nitroimidazol reductase NimA-like FMN-containing flavoprotein (pyridoxamine 5'-phosphate oxidase superfamily)